MGRLNPNFDCIPSDFYVTPPRALPPLLPFLEPQRRYVEPAAGNGALIDLLAQHGHCCVAAFDIDPHRNDIAARNALDLGEADLGDATIFLTNLPWSWPVFPQLVKHLIALRPLWTLAPARFAHAARSATLVDRCSHIVCVPRLQWIPGTRDQSTQDTVWLRFDASHRGGPHFYPRETRSADPWATEA
ncbi:hypothetical protein [Mesorhizobium sp.]|uniref:hypothetical protein n=1 Tax=Mesorhizobium sp. TaxID=1871066 RepID=UPI001225B100|nr:hypothetical protein [Mesorhizobium sp.]TIT00213.1 MAG: hypothetical protein E5W87_19735 [Mesorhizobium sp.]